MRLLPAQLMACDYTARLHAESASPKAEATRGLPCCHADRTPHARYVTADQVRTLFNRPDLVAAKIAVTRTASCARKPSASTSMPIDLSPGFQRRERWDADKQSALIESFLLNVPVPPVYLAEEQDGTYTAIDGKQRLRAIAEFMKDRLNLRNLDRLEQAEGLDFDQLPPEIANSLRLRPYMRVVTLLKQTNASLKYEVFLRLNRGGEILNHQEIRNVAYRGSLNDLIYRLSVNAFLRRQLKITDDSSSAFKKMDDAEYVLRFLTLKERVAHFSGKLAHEMNEFMERHQNAGEARIHRLGEDFLTAIDRCELIWGELAFKRPDGDGWRDQLLAGMFDAQMLSVTNLTAKEMNNVLARNADILEGTRQLFNDRNFETAVRTGTNTPNRIRYRVGEVERLLKGA